MNIQELKDNLEEVRQSIPVCLLDNLFDNMKGRMERVIESKSNYINK